ncbi:Cobalamin-binding protein [Candidatus Anstonella stagnisolia]|nr:Cobalamin-binding protein [Candidatus Anstonella stagnisolia]
MRIISLAPSNTEILFALGAQSSLAGVTHLCDFPPAAKKLPKIGSWTSSHDFSTMEKLKPNLLLASMYVPPALEKWAAEKSIPLLSVCPTSLEGIYKSIEKIGSIVQKEEDAKTVISEMKAKLAQIKSASSGFPSHPKIYCEEFNSPPFASANWVPELVQTAGGIPFSRAGIFSYPTNLLELSSFNPDLIVLHWCGFGERSDIPSVAKRSGWGSLAAVQNNKIFSLDDTFLNRPSPRIWMGAQKLQEKIRHSIEN